MLDEKPETLVNVRTLPRRRETLFTKHYKNVLANPFFQLHPDLVIIQAVVLVVGLCETVFKEEINGSCRRTVEKLYLGRPYPAQAFLP
jgi:hypothetical protein